MKQKRSRPRSGCPLAYALDFVGDRWTLLVLRDLIIYRKRHFQEFLESEESIATNILANRLRQLEGGGLVLRSRDPGHGGRVVYAPTAKALDLLPAMLEILRWGDRNFAASAAPRALVRGIANDRAAVVAQIRSQHKVRRA